MIYLPASLFSDEPKRRFCRSSTQEAALCQEFQPRHPEVHQRMFRPGLSRRIFSTDCMRPESTCGRRWCDYRGHPTSSLVLCRRLAVWRDSSRVLAEFALVPTILDTRRRSASEPIESSPRCQVASILRLLRDELCNFRFDGEIVKEMWLKTYQRWWKHS